MAIHSRAATATAGRSALPDGNTGGRMKHSLLADENFMYGSPHSGQVDARSRWAMGGSKLDNRADAAAVPRSSGRQQADPMAPTQDAIMRATEGRDNEASENLAGLKRLPALV
jgi:hypothetical protein